MYEKRVVCVCVSVYVYIRDQVLLTVYWCSVDWCQCFVAQYYPLYTTYDIVATQGPSVNMHYAISSQKKALWDILFILKSNNHNFQEICKTKNNNKKNNHK